MYFRELWSDAATAVCVKWPLPKPVSIQVMLYTGIPALGSDAATPLCVKWALP